MSRIRSAALLVAMAVASVTAAGAQSADQTVRLRFAAVVGDRPVACGQTYEGIGTSKSAIIFVDFRMYISRARLVKADGSEQPVKLTQDGLWQLDDVALLDFENGSGACVSGTQPTRDFIEGRVPAGSYVGVRFDMGLPFDKNHREPTLQPSPLNLTRMFWSWNAGYKFIRMDIRSTGQPKGWMVHLGSTGCTPNESVTKPPVSCGQPNVAKIDLKAFDVAKDLVELDVKRMLALSDVDTNTPATAAGCMGAPNDPDCSPILRQFGLQLAPGAASPQTVFRARPSSGAAGK
jgi:uncharacterized repeat protein (TIGR04052 family)